MSLVTGTIMSIYLPRMPSIATILACVGLSDILADAVNIFQVKFQFFVCQPHIKSSNSWSTLNYLSFLGSSAHHMSFLNGHIGQCDKYWKTKMAE